MEMGFKLIGLIIGMKGLIRKIGGTGLELRN